MLCQIVLSIAMLFTPVIYSAETQSALHCDKAITEDLHILATHIKTWSDLITFGKSSILSVPWDENGTSVTYCRNVRFVFRPTRLSYVGDTYYLKFEKRMGTDGKISFNARDKHFAAIHSGLEKIGTFLAPLYAVHIRSITLDDNKLTSFQEIHQAILNVCPVLITFSAARNQFSDELIVHHLNLQRLDLSYNKLKKIKHIYLPNCVELNLAENSIQEVEFEQMPKTMEPLLRNNIIWSFDAAQQKQCAEFVHNYYNVELCKVVPAPGSTTSSLVCDIDEFMTFDDHNDALGSNTELSS